jgi:hypothetical protein
MSQRPLYARTTLRESPFSFACEIQALLGKSGRSSAPSVYAHLIAIRARANEPASAKWQFHIPNL